MNPVITIENFDGPLDLLWSLIKKKNVDIYEINLLEVIEQYIDYIKNIKNLNLNIAGDYLVMTSELIEIKSKSLLPNNKEIIEEDEEDLEAKLISRLLEYQEYKELTPKFKKLQEERNLIFTKSPEKISTYSDNEIVNEQMDRDVLIDALNKMLARIEYDKPLTTKITNKELSVKECSSGIIKKLKISDKIDFIDLMEEKSKDYIVVNFLAILNLVRKQEINITQHNNFSKIIIELRNDNE